MSIRAIEPSTAGTGPFYPAAWYMDEDGHRTSHIWPEEFETEDAAYELAKSRCAAVNEAATAAFQPGSMFHHILECAAHDEVPAALRNIAQRLLEDASELESTWQDEQAGAPWRIIAHELERCASRIARKL